MLTESVDIISKSLKPILNSIFDSILDYIVKILTNNLFVNAFNSVEITNCAD